MLELRNSFASIFQKTGDLSFADKAEKLTFNGIMGFRNKEGTAITYGKPDNCTVIGWGSIMERKNLMMMLDINIPLPILILLFAAYPTIHETSPITSIRCGWKRGMVLQQFFMPPPC